jgi:hypothetical protein
MAMVLRAGPRTPGFHALALAAVVLLCSACTTVAHVTSLPEPACRASVERGFATILQGQGESTEVGMRIASSATGLLAQGIGPRPFVLASPSGADYSFFIERKDGTCLLRLYGRQKGFVSYTNNLTYIATEPLAPCQCAE